MISDHEAASAVVEFAICRYFPAEDFQRAQVARVLIEMVNDKAELDWLVSTQVKIGEWKGLGELRGIFCTRFYPRDNLSLAAETPGFTPDDLEAAYHQRVIDESRRIIAGDQKAIVGSEQAQEEARFQKLWKERFPVQR